MPTDPQDPDALIDGFLQRPSQVSPGFTAQTLRRIQEDQALEQGLDRLLQSPTTVSADFTAQTLARLRREKRRRLRLWTLRWSAAAIALLALGLHWARGPQSPEAASTALSQPPLEYELAQTDGLLRDLEAGLDPTATVLLDEHALNTIATLSSL